MSAIKKRPLNIHRFNTTNRINRLKKLNNDNKSTSEGNNDNDSGKSQQALTKSLGRDSNEYLETLIIQTLFPNSSREENSLRSLLPALTSSNNIDLQLYAFISLFLKKFLISWYNNVTDDYQFEFLNEVLYLLAHITRFLEVRLRKLNLIDFLFDDLFIIFDSHLLNYSRLIDLNDSLLLPIPSLPTSSKNINENLIVTFQKLDYHPGCDDETLYLKLISYNFLNKILTADELNSKLSLNFLSTITNEFFLKQMVDKLSEPYIIWEIIGSCCDAILQKEKPRTEIVNEADDNSNNDSGILRSLFHAIAYTTSALSNDKSKSVGETSYHVFEFLNHLLNLNDKAPLSYSILKIINNNLHAKIRHLLRNLINNFLILKTFHNENFLISLISNLRLLFFPKDDELVLEERFIPTTEEELKTLMNEVKFKILKIFNDNLYFWCLKKFLYFQNDKLLETEVDNFLKSFEIKEINKHLILRLLDLMMLRIIDLPTASQ
ncbi:hypothetical protein PACTADRAFT_185786 [Pachysolen tannophilus NRRL Y-2460]|uniref:PXA domain-containing protein n=1 Tax=Pachysolen tannophilus NRRL Y-2460 TaxID=669874 RepID=A0A1E4U1N5_PACTA|nr:hypothetical protein PACTADRAFT_185786 [Pachysolen tannophilus NRRL Y-2460]